MDLENSDSTWIWVVTFLFGGGFIAYEIAKKAWKREKRIKENWGASVPRFPGLASLIVLHLLPGCQCDLTLSSALLRASYEFLQLHTCHLRAYWFPRTRRSPFLDRLPSAFNVCRGRVWKLHRGLYRKDGAQPACSHVPLSLHAGSHWPGLVHIHHAQDPRPLLVWFQGDCLWCLHCPDVLYSCSLGHWVHHPAGHGLWPLYSHLPPIAPCCSAQQHSNSPNLCGGRGPWIPLLYPTASAHQTAGLLPVQCALALLLCTPGRDEVGTNRHIAQYGLWSDCHPPDYGHGRLVHLPVLFSDYTNSSTTAFQVRAGQGLWKLCVTHQCGIGLLCASHWPLGGTSLWKQPSSHCACSHGWYLPTPASCDQSHYLCCQNQTDQNSSPSYVQAQLWQGPSDCVKQVTLTTPLPLSLMAW